MPLTPEQMDQFLDQHFEFERTDNIDGVLSTLAPDAIHDVIGWPSGPSHGRDAAKGFYEALFADLADGSTESQWRRYGENFVVDETIWTGIAAGRPFGLEGRNRPLTFRLLHFIEFLEDGTMAREQVWCDVPAIMAQLPQD
jgi:hypothetical protein